MTPSRNMAIPAIEDQAKQERTATVDGRIKRGTRAAQILEDPVVIEAFKSLRDDIYVKWQVAQTTEQRESLHGRLSSLNDLQAKFQSFMHDGQLAESRNR